MVAVNPMLSHDHRRRTMVSDDKSWQIADSQTIVKWSCKNLRLSYIYDLDSNMLRSLKTYHKAILASDC